MTTSDNTQDEIRAILQLIEMHNTPIESTYLYARLFHTYTYCQLDGDQRFKLELTTYLHSAFINERYHAWAVECYNPVTFFDQEYCRNNCETII